MADQRAGAGESVDDAIRRVTAALPGGELREGQLAMARAVAEALVDDEHLVVQAGTGTGKSLAYLVPVVLGGRRTVVATATKALQEQLVNHDIPVLAEHLGVPFTAALLKGRSNYLCRASLADAIAGEGQQSLLGEAVDRATLGEVVAWSVDTSTGDREDLPMALRDDQWARLSVGVGECPGASKCAFGDVCFAEDARARAAEADIVVVNTHLYGLHLATGGGVLPEHDVVVIDEAHALADVAADTLGCVLGPGRLEHLARTCRGLFTPDHPAAVGLDAAAGRLAAALEGIEGAVATDQGDLAVTLVGAAEAVSAAATAARGLDVGGDAGTRKERLVQLAGHLGGDIALLAQPGEGQVTWVEGGSLRLAPVDVGELLAAQLFDGPTVVLTSATLAVGGTFGSLAERLGLERAPRSWRGLDVGSPFDYQHQALLYCAAHLPEPRSPAYEPAMLAELERLVVAAGGRTLALFTSRRAMRIAADHLRGTIEHDVLVQDELPRPVLQQRFIEEESSVLVATMGFWQGFDAPGRTCSLVVIDKLPFARPDDPLVQARRNAATKAKQNSFAAVDLPAAAVLLAQGAGRLIRHREDRGVVAVLDRRLATASYRWTLVRSLPPMRRTKDVDEVIAFLTALS